MNSVRPVRLIITYVSVSWLLPARVLRKPPLLGLSLFFLITLYEVVVDGNPLLRLHRLLEFLTCLKNFGSWASRRTLDGLGFSMLGLLSLAGLLVILVGQDTLSLAKYHLCLVRDGVLGGVVRMFAVNIDNTAGELPEEYAVRIRIIDLTKGVGCLAMLSEGRKGPVHLAAERAPVFGGLVIIGFEMANKLTSFLECFAGAI